MHVLAGTCYSIDNANVLKVSTVYCILLSKMFFLSSIKCLDYNHHIHVQVTSNYRSNQNLITLNDDMAMNFSCDNFPNFNFDLYGTFQ